MLHRCKEVKVFLEKWEMRAYLFMKLQLVQSEKKKDCREWGPMSNKGIRLFAPMIMLHWKQNTSSFSKTHKLKNLIWLCKLKTNTRVMNGPECDQRTPHFKEMMLALGLLKRNHHFFMVNVLWEDTHSAHLTQFGEHHNDGGIVFPKHPPEVFGGLCQGPLGSNVGLLLSELQRIKIAC